MKYFNLNLVAFTLAAFLLAEGAFAQEAVAVVQRSEPSAPYLLALGASIGSAPASIVHLEDPGRAKLEKQVRINRGVLIGTSVVTAVGLPLWMVATTRKCDGGFAQRTDLTCTQTGKVMRGTGIALFAGGLTGMLISGTMLGVRKRQLKDRGARVENPKSRALRWDPGSSQFVF